jgi:multisubunit Na+/H+ antiporter MnhC subunit
LFQRCNAEAKIIEKVRFGLYLILSGIILFVIGLVAEDYHQFSHTSEGYLSGVSYPLYPLGVALIVISIVLFLVGSYLILKEKIKN